MPSPPIEVASAAALYDRFLRIADEAADPKAVALWERSGGRHFHKEGEGRPRGGDSQVRRQIPPDLTAQLREVGLHWNRLLIQWEGKVEWEEAKGFAEGKGGKISKVKASIVASHRSLQAT